jgi:hypothetical protein
MRRRRKITPVWLSVTRKLYTYIGGTSLLTLLSDKFNLDEVSKDLLIQFFFIGLTAIQIVCDVSYAREKPEDFAPDKTDKIKS